MVKRSKEQLKEAVKNYIRRNPEVTVDNIECKFSVNVHRIFGGIKEAYDASGIKYPRPKTERNVVRKQVIRLIRNDRLTTAEDIYRKTGVYVYKYFKNLADVYKIAGVEFLPNYLKRRIRKKNLVINYIKANPNATQWEINRDCNCHVQEMFERGIRGAYGIACVEYDKNRRKIYGTAVKSIRKRSADFENKISNLLKERGADIQVKTKSGTADAVIGINKDVFVVEIKDYRTKPISDTDIKQIKRYLSDLNLKRGIIVTSGRGEIKRIKNDGFEISITPEDKIDRLWGSLSSQVG